MGWQDRDYARAGPARGGIGSARSMGSSWTDSVVTVLIVINVAVYAVGTLFPAIGQWLSGYQTGSILGITHHLGIGEMQSDAVMRGHIWRLITAQYLHAGTWHLAFNMIGLHFLGRPLERMWSPRKFFAIYTLCGLFGNVFYVILGAAGVIDPLMPAVGASGSIYGLLGIVAVMFPHATVYIYFLFPLKIRTAAMIFAGIAVLSIFSRGENFGGEACHLAGLVFGVWWAYRGDRWWSTTRWRIGNRAGRVRPVQQNPRAREPRKGIFTENVAQRRADAATIDQILRKVHDGGIHTLSEAEKRELRDATTRQQARDESLGRSDRL